ncbi:MAG: carbon-nitrogen hydrolase [Gammaproteobacteria bacterium]|nr:MAG: carbon-nitrogen hydrolase [Gammaproteobacteria bacterium]
MKVALIQEKYQNSKKKSNQIMIQKIQEAATTGAELVVLQELHQSEYFCQSENTDFFAYAEDFQEDVSFWSQVAKDNKVVLVTSLFEKRTAGLYHNTSVVFDKDGSIAGKYQKMHIPDDPGFYEKFYFTPGDLGFEPIQTSLGKLGVLICWDQWYPEAARIMALKGAELLIYPTAIGWFEQDSEAEKQRQLESWQTIQRSHAIANGIPVLACNRVGFEADSSGVMDGIQFWGHSFICGSQGEILAQAKEEASILYANIDQKQSKEVRDIWPFLRDRRIESYDCILQRFCDDEL